MFDHFKDGVGALAKDLSQDNWDRGTAGLGHQFRAHTHNNNCASGWVLVGSSAVGFSFVVFLSGPGNEGVQMWRYPPYLSYRGTSTQVS
jgi:hypothetical protein